MAKDISQAEVMSNSKKIKPVALAMHFQVMRVRGQFNN